MQTKKNYLIKEEAEEVKMNMIHQRYKVRNQIENG